MCAPRFETIDATDVDTDFWGHGYHLNSLQVLDDLRLLKHLKVGADSRVTDKETKNGQPYWNLPPR